MLSLIRIVSDKVNTPRIGFAANFCCVSDEKAARLRSAREKAGYDSATSAAAAFGWGEAGYRHHENGTRGFGPDAAKKYGRAFRVKPGWLLCLPGIDDGEPNGYKSADFLHVGAEVEAGMWRDEEGEVETLDIDTPPPVPEAKRYGYRLAGRSMDQVYEPGTILDCISIYANGVAPQTGDHVIVRRTKPDGLRELTVKEFEDRDGVFYLHPRSSLAKFKPMEIGSPTEGMVDGDQVEVIAFVVATITPRALGLLDRLGKVRRRKAH